MERERLRLINCIHCGKTWFQNEEKETFDYKGNLATTTQFDEKCFISCNCSTVIGYIDINEKTYHHNEEDFEIYIKEN